MTVEGRGPGDIVERGKAIYRERIQNLVEDAEDGKFVVIDVESGDYEIDVDDIAASLRLRSRRPGAVTYAARAGRRTSYRMGGRKRTFKT